MGCLQVGGGGASPPSPPIKLSPSEAQREIRVTREYAAWSDGLREYDQWVADQECRARVLGRFTSGWRSGTRRCGNGSESEVKQDGNAGEIALWEDAELRVDYSAAELGGVA